MTGWSLRGQVAGADDVALRVIGHLSGDEYQTAAGRGDEIGYSSRAWTARPD